MTEHTLKTWPGVFEATRTGRKLFEFRRDDRSPPFAVDDRLVLVEWDPATKRETGRALEAGVSFVLRGAHGVPDGFAVLSLVGVRPRRDQLADDRALVARLTAIEDGLTEWEVRFVESLARWVESGPLTTAQRDRALGIDSRG